jgi:hypothetical protein
LPLVLAALVLVALAVTVIRAADPAGGQPSDGVRATLSATARPHGQPPPTVVGPVAVAAALMAASAWIGSAVFATVDVRRRSVSPIRRRGPPPTD